MQRWLKIQISGESGAYCKYGSINAITQRALFDYPHLKVSLPQFQFPLPVPGKGAQHQHICCPGMDIRGGRGPSPQAKPQQMANDDTETPGTKKRLWRGLREVQGTPTYIGGMFARRAPCARPARYF